ncbi:MAG: 2-C-methyl-D-erythritol 4-phosphate cytidylyltransferase [Chlamydiia bacterium]|nr:2-C-methyl-D-erythritol 4-phosphate cytidylyltransferase [Chlamydiia bacterium]
MTPVAVILLAGGQGVRMGEAMPKQFLPLGEKPIARYSFDLFSTLSFVSEIIVVTPADFQDLFPSSHAEPGKTRQESLRNGFDALTSAAEWVLVHDSARPFISKEMVEKVCEGAFEVGAAALATPVQLTIKEVNANHLVRKTLDRSTLVAMQTPQVMRRDWLQEGLENDIAVTDDVALVEALGYPVKIVPGSEWNCKITTPTDLFFAQTLVEHAKLPF